MAMILSILAHTRHGYKPRNAVLEVSPGRRLHSMPVSSHAQLDPGLMMYRFHHSMYFANTEDLSEEVFELVNTAQPPLSWFCIDAVAVDDIDFSAAATLREIYRRLKEKGIRLVMAEVESNVRLELDRSELTDLIGKDYFFETIGDVETAFNTEMSHK